MSAVFYSACLVSRINEDEDPFMVMLYSATDEDGLSVEIDEEVELDLADLHPNSQEALRKADPDDDLEVMIKDEWLERAGYL